MRIATDYLINPLRELCCFDTLATIASVALLCACVPVLQIIMTGG